MTTQTTDTLQSSARGAVTDVPFGVNEMRLRARQWAAVAVIVLACAMGIPWLWQRVEPLETGRGYRVPYALSKDYWLCQRRLDGIVDPASVPVLGDSVIWGEYVRPDGTLTHFLNQETAFGRKGTGTFSPPTMLRTVPGGKMSQSPAASERFLNCGVNGLFPLAMEGLVRYYGESLGNRKLIVHFNLLWLTSPKADLSTAKEENFNHQRLVPQFYPRIPCYRADTAERLGAVVERNVGFFAWVSHVNDVYFNHESLPLWTLEDDGSMPPHRQNAWRNPLRQFTRKPPGEPRDDPERGPSSPRHRPWTEGGAGPARFDWVPLDQSLQWQAFQRLLGLLRRRGNDVLVVVGPFNEHMVAESQRAAYRQIRDGVAAWLETQQVACLVPEVLPSHLYADASHPLTDGYALLAKQICGHRFFRQWASSGRQ
jgi:hypothetical protein